MSEQTLLQTKPIATKSTLNTGLPRTTIAPVAHGILQRCSNGVECADCRAKREQQEGTLQRAAVNAAPTPAVPPIVHDVLSSPGWPLDAATQAFMEPRFGHDFSGVRLHIDARAAESARAVHALAYTVGSDVVFGTGQYMPGTMVGKRLLAHELTHTIQQSQGSASSMAAKSVLQVNQPGDSHEQEADRMADSIVYGSFVSPHVSVSPATPSTTLQRAPADNPSKRAFQGVKRSKDGSIQIDEVWLQGDTLQIWGQRAIRDYMSWRFGNLSAERVSRMQTYLNTLPNEYSSETPIVGQTYILGLTKQVEITLVRLSGQRQTPPPSATDTSDTKDTSPGAGDTQGETADNPKKTIKDPDEAKGTEDKTKESGNTAKQEEIPPEVSDFYKGAIVAPNQQISTAELMRMYYLFTRFIKGNPQWVQQGQSFKDWVDFLDKNAKQLRGKLEATETGKLQLDTLKRLTEKLDKGETLEFPDQEEKELSEKARQAKLKEGISLTAGSPEWLLLPLEDRKLLLEVMEKHPALFSDTQTGADTPKKLTTGAKRSMALRISINYFPGEVGKSLLAMAQDPSFWLTMAGIIAIYVGLWLAPEPFSKIAATALTAYLLTRVGFDIILAFARAWSRLNNSCENDAKTGAELENVAKRFAADLGPAGATILIMIATWALGKAARSFAPKGTAAPEGGEVPPETPPARPSGPPKLEVIQGGKGSSPGTTMGSTVRPSGTGGASYSGGGRGGRGGAQAAQALKSEPLPAEPAPRTYPRVVPEPVEQPIVKPEPQVTTPTATGQPKAGLLTPTQTAAAVGTAAQVTVKKEEKKKSKCQQIAPRAIPIHWPAPQWPERNGVNDPGSYDPAYDLPHEALLLKMGETLYNPNRPEVDRYRRIISGPPFNITVPASYPIHHKWPLYLGGPGDAEQAEGKYDAKGRIIVSPNLVVMSPGAHNAWHKYLKEQPIGPRSGEGPSEQTPDGTQFCVLENVGE